MFSRDARLTVKKGGKGMAKQKGCAAKTKEKKKCKNKATGKSKYCNVHKK